MLRRTNNRGASTPAPTASAESPLAARGGHSVSIDGVSRRFGDVRAVDDVSVDVHAGDFLSILGPSGCGKTTLLRMIAGLDYPDSGRVLIDERDVTWLPANKRPTNLVFQRGALFPHKSAFDNVAYPLQRLGYGKVEVREAVDEALTMVRMGDLSRRLPSELSGGQAQRVALARALVGRPAVLLLDEPLSSLDLSLRKEMQLELRRLQEQLGTTFIYVTHDQEEALTMSSRIVIMRDGRVVQTGTPREIYENPTSVFASTFIGETNLLLGDVTESHNGVVTLSVAGHELRVPEPRTVPVGTRVALSVRPERIRTAAPATLEGDWNRMSGTVEELVFLGNRIRARVDCGGVSLWAQENPSTSAATRLAENTSMTIGWALADGRLILSDDDGDHGTAGDGSGNGNGTVAHSE
jgi:ABC-type Fe3+/spermidine/putrescine transport system ATPase subunit